jgi:hypothetical protein
VSSDQANKTVVPSFVRAAGVVGLFAFFVGRGLAPALRGAREGLDQVIAVTDKLGSFATYLFALTGLLVMIFQTMLTLRETKLTTLYRVVSTVAGACVVSIVARAFHDPLPERESFMGALASGLMAILSCREAISVPRTRALGALLFFAGLAALFHLGASELAFNAVDSNLVRLSRVVATGSVVFDTMALLTAFGWLATRPEKSTVWAARVALFFAFTLAWGMARGGPGMTGPLWQVVYYRAINPIITHPPAYVWAPVRYGLEASAALLALVAVTARRQIPAVAGAFTLALLARPTTDVPLSALALALAAMAAPLAAHDDRGMWAVLMANSERSHAA